MRTDTSRSVFFHRLMIAAGISSLLFIPGCHHAATVGTISPGRSAGPGASGPGPGTTSVEPGTDVRAPLEPDASITPGATLPVTKDDICVSGYSKKVRNVPESVKKQAYAAYNIAHHTRGEFEVDHLISLELGGSNSIKNLWPQSYKTQPWNAHVKDQLENALHADVCSGKVDLPVAQREIAGDWIGAYKREFHTDAPLANADKSARQRHRGPLAADAGGAGDGDDATAPVPAPAPALRAAAQNSAPGTAGQVWVNLNSGKYFYPGSAHYGTTKHGQYMSEADAQSKGYVAAKGQSTTQ